MRYFVHSLRQDLHTAMTPNGTDRAILPLPSSLSFLYYVFRPIRLVREHRLSQLKLLMNTFQDEKQNGKRFFYDDPYVLMLHHVHLLLEMGDVPLSNAAQLR